MKTTEELLATIDEAGTRASGFHWAAIRPADLDLAATTIRQLQGQLAQAAANACHCERAGEFNVTGHIERIEARGDIRTEFARRSGAGKKHGFPA